jgi:hypothetical protein
VISKMVLSSWVRLDERVAKGDWGPSSSANSCTFHGDIFVMADSALCKTAENANNVHHNAAPCRGVKRDLMGVPIGPADARTAFNGHSSELKNNGTRTDRSKANGLSAGMPLMLRNADGNRNLDRTDGGCWKDSIRWTLPRHRVCGRVIPRIIRVDDDELRSPEATTAISKATIALELPRTMIGSVCAEILIILLHRFNFSRHNFVFEGGWAGELYKLKGQFPCFVAFKLHITGIAR